MEKNMPQREIEEGKPVYSEEIIKYRQCRRVAVVLRGHWEDNEGAHSGIFDMVTPMLVKNTRLLNNKKH
jgi:hypothetical protein